jgi:hypothetical protein
MDTEIPPDDLDADELDPSDYGDFRVATAQVHFSSELSKMVRALGDAKSEMIQYMCQRELGDFMNAYKSQENIECFCREIREHLGRRIAVTPYIDSDDILTFFLDLVPYETSRHCIYVLPDIFGIH